MNDLIRTILLALAAFFFFMGVGYVLYLTNADTLFSECVKYEEVYGYDTELVGNFWVWDGKFNCVVLMEDGTEVELRDFDISDYKKPKMVISSAA